MNAAAGAVEKENPLAAGLERLPVHPTALTIFGATGDLAKRKLLPALYNLAHDGALPERFHLIGSSRSDLSDDDYRRTAEEAIRQFSRRPPDDAVLAALLEHVRYVPGAFDDGSVYERLGQALGEFDDDAGQPLNRAFYLSTAPEFFPVIVERLGAAGLDRHGDAEVRCIIEKPFGTTLAEAQELNARVLSVFEERQVFRIDHYLGKETVQNLMAFRFANGLFEPVWNRNYIDHVQITAAEDIGIGSRAGYYDHAGALRDLVQNHMLQLLCNIAMEPPVDFSADAVRDERSRCCGRSAPRRRRASARWPCARSTRPAPPAGRRCPATSTRRACPRTPTPRPTRRCAGDPELALGGRAVLPADRQAAGAQGHRDRRDAQARPPPRVPPGGIGRRQAQRARRDAAAERGRLALARREDPRRAHAHPAGQHGVPLRHGVPLAVARGLRAPDHGRDARRRDALHPQRRGRGAVAHLRPDRAAWEDTPGPLPSYEAGTQGPPEAAALLRGEDVWRAI